MTNQCDKVLEWLGLGRPGEHGEALREHIRCCPRCARLEAMDSAAEKAVARALRRRPAPDGLRRAVVGLVEESPAATGRPAWRRAVPMFAAAALVVFLAALAMLRPSLHETGVIPRLADLAERFHMADQPVAYKAVNAADAARWLEENLARPVAVPRLPFKDMRLVGAGRSSFDGRPAAYMSFQRGNRRYSLLELGAGGREIPMVANTVYRYPVRSCVVELWKEKNSIFVLVN